MPVDYDWWINAQSIFLQQLYHNGSIEKGISNGDDWLGVRMLSETKRIMISLPQHLLQEVDGLVEKENSNRSELVRQAMKMYLHERKKRLIREMMQQGYMEMAKINLNIASEAFEAEEEADDKTIRLVSGV
ncbi:CopG family transcriptional regulator/antitoxin EndoAI [Desmospora activa DSM 45169]|uniref:CopG family transcriptional regulator/antitoxin EndoAI n=2 Tax=Desmospora TaxID=500614 RepID=A0A2T4Z0P6_9BACL|nr:CopG family transcriptional regulator/antitoxin EndoAI [Desmospora activa DSM 45169]